MLECFRSYCLLWNKEDTTTVTTAIITPCMLEPSHYAAFKQEPKHTRYVGNTFLPNNMRLLFIHNLNTFPIHNLTTTYPGSPLIGNQKDFFNYTMEIFSVSVVKIKLNIRTEYHLFFALSHQQYSAIKPQIVPLSVSHSC